MRIISSDNLYIVVGLLALTIIQGNVVEGDLNCYVCNSGAAGCDEQLDTSLHQVTQCAVTESCFYHRNTLLGGIYRECRKRTADGCLYFVSAPEGENHAVTCYYCTTDGCNAKPLRKNPATESANNPTTESTNNPGNNARNSATSAPRQIRSIFGFASQIGLHHTVMVASFWLMF